MGSNWGKRALKSTLKKVAEVFPSWSGSQVIRSEGNFLVDEFLTPQTWTGLLYGDIIVKESVWNRYLGRLADPEGEFTFFGIRCEADNRVGLDLGFRSFGDFLIESEMVSLVHNLEESALVLRYKSHKHDGGNWKSRIGSWLLHTFGIRFCSRFYQMDWGSSVRITQDKDLFRVDFRKPLWNSSFAHPVIEGKNILELITIESARVEKGRARLQAAQKGIELMERLGFWLANQNDDHEK